MSETGPSGQGPPALWSTPGQELATGQRQDDTVAEEWPVALVVNGVSHAVMMATPADLEDFAFGFALSEGLIRTPTELLDVQVEAQPDGALLQLRVTAACEARLRERRRMLSGRTGCGLCGVQSLRQLGFQQAPRVEGTLPALAALQAAGHALHAAQPMNAHCGGLHAAAWCDLQGGLTLVREDVGRHNALDKLIGGRWHAGLSGEPGFALLTSRASVELVHKCLQAGIGGLATVSAPTAAAVRHAQAHGLVLLAFVREGRATRYA